jgi:hypothetical protein
MRTHEALATASHPHPGVAATSNEPFPPETAKLSPLREMSTVQVVNPVCVTVCVTLPAVMPLVRDAASALAAARYVTVPLPEPDPPDTIVSHVAIGTAVQLHAPSVFTSNEAVPPAASSVRLAGCSAYEHVRPCCVTDTDCPPTVRAPVREAVPELAATETVTVPGPDPDVPPVAVIQDAPELAVHAHPLPVATETVPVPPAAPIVIDVGVNV